MKPDRRWWWQKALSELTLEVFFGLCVTGQVRFGASESGENWCCGVSRIFQGFSKDFPRISKMKGGEPMKFFHFKS